MAGLGSVCAIRERASAAEQLVRLLDGARPMLLMRNRVRVDKVDANTLLGIVLMPGRDDQGQENNTTTSSPPPYESATRYEMRIRSR
jgi:hypothetical protein